MGNSCNNIPHRKDLRTNDFNKIKTVILHFNLQDLNLLKFLLFNVKFVSNSFDSEIKLIKCLNPALPANLTLSIKVNQLNLEF